MADDLADDDYYIREEPVEENEISSSTTTTTTKAKTKKKKKLAPKRSLGTFSDLTTMLRTHYQKSKSELELNELLSGFTPAIALPSPSSSSTELDEYLNELIPTKRWSKRADLPGAPVVLIIAASALRCIELGKMLKKKQPSRSIQYLFAKHKKLDEQIALMQKDTTLINIIIGTPKRIDDILVHNAMNFKRLYLVLIDWNVQNVKQQRLIDLYQLKTELCHLLCEQILLHRRFVKEKTHIALF